jgi:hypothetical protein
MDALNTYIKINKYVNLNKLKNIYRMSKGKCTITEAHRLSYE